MGNIMMTWEPWEIDSFGALREYLIVNSEKMYSPSPLLNGKTREEVGECIKYEFDNFIGIVIYHYNNGGGKIVLVGEDFNLMGQRFSELESIMGFKKICSK